MGEISLIDVATEVLTIHKNWNFHFKGDSPSDYCMHAFPQLWGSTSTGFEGIGGCAMTEQMTYVFIGKKSELCHVFFGSRLAYTCVATDAFISDVYKCDVCGQWDCKKKYSVVKIGG